MCAQVCFCKSSEVHEILFVNATVAQFTDVREHLIQFMSTHTRTQFSFFRLLSRTRKFAVVFVFYFTFWLTSLLIHFPEKMVPGTLWFTFLAFYTKQLCAILYINYFGVRLCIPSMVDGEVSWNIRSFSTCPLSCSKPQHNREEFCLCRCSLYFKIESVNNAKH